MEFVGRESGAPWRWSLLLAVFFINLFLPSLVLSYGVVLVQLVNLELPLWIGLSTPTVFIIIVGLTQCWCREAADSWGGAIGYRVMASIGLSMVVISLILCAFIPLYLHPCVYGILGGLGTSIISAQVDAVIFDTYDVRLDLIRGLCFTGQAVGQTIFPHIIMSLIDYYEFQHSHIVFAGLMLQILPAVLLLRLDDITRPTHFSRYNDIANAYAAYSVDTSDSLTTELQLDDLSRKCWKSPSDDNLHREEDGSIYYDNIATITPPPSPEEKRRNIFGVEILPEIPEESEESDGEQSVTEGNVKKKRFSAAIKRLSILGDSFDEFIVKQTRNNSLSEREQVNGEYTELDVTYDNISPMNNIERDKIINSFTFRCQRICVGMRRRICMPSYRVYKIRRRMAYLMCNLNETFIKPLTRSLSYWRFYPALLLYFVKISLTAICLTLLPVIASHVRPKISSSETNFLMSLHGFTWICFLLSTPWLAQMPKHNFKHVTLIGLFISTAACFVLAEANNHDMFSMGCVIAGFGYGAITSTYEDAAKNFIGVRKWPKLHSSLETISSILLGAFYIGISHLLDRNNGLQCPMFILGGILSVTSIVWLVLTIVELYVTKARSLGVQKTWVT